MSANSGLRTSNSGLNIGNPALAVFGVSLAVLLLAGVGCGRPKTQAGQPIDVRIAVGGLAQIVYLPTSLAQQLDYYRAEGLNVTLQDFPGGAKALQALFGGSADVVSGFYDHTIQMAAEGRSLRAFVTLLQYPGMVLVVSPQSRRKITRVEDLKGAMVGVTAAGSSSHMTVNYLLIRHGLSPDDVSVTSIGHAATALAAVERGKVDAAVVTDPTLAVLLKRNPTLTLLADTRTGEGVQAAFGVATYPASVLYSTQAWVEQNPEAARRLARAMKRTLQWLQTHDPRDIMEKVPAAQRGEDPTVYLESLKASMSIFSPDGLMTAEGPEAVRKVLSLSLPKVREAGIDLSKTYTNDFVRNP